MGREKKAAAAVASGSKAKDRHKKNARHRDRWAAAPPPPSLIARAHVPLPKSTHQSYFELVENKDKKKKLEFQITTAREPPPGFEFVPIGNPSLTTACKELSREKDAMIFIVSNTKDKDESRLTIHLNRVGHHIRRTIVEEARAQLGQDTEYFMEVADGHPEPIPETQEEINAQADAVMRDLFPRMPNTDRQIIIDHSFRKGPNHKGDRTVGLAPQLTLSRRVQLAVLAHIRHTHTRYDQLLKETNWHVARKAIESLCLDILVKWRGDEETGRDQLDEILREVIVISDSEDSDDDSEYESDDSEDDETLSPVSSSASAGGGNARPGGLGRADALAQALVHAQAQAHTHAPAPAPAPAPAQVHPQAQAQAQARAQSRAQAHGTNSNVPPPQRQAETRLNGPSERMDGVEVHHRQQALPTSHLGSRRKPRGFRRYEAAAQARWEQARERVRHEHRSDGLSRPSPATAPVPPDGSVSYKPPVSRQVYDMNGRLLESWGENDRSSYRTDPATAAHTPLDSMDRLLLPLSRPQPMSGYRQSHERVVSQDSIPTVRPLGAMEYKRWPDSSARPALDLKDYLVPSIEPRSPGLERNPDTNLEKSMGAIFVRAIPSRSQLQPSPLLRRRSASPARPEKDDYRSPVFFSPREREPLREPRAFGERQFEGVAAYAARAHPRAAELPRQIPGPSAVRAPVLLSQQEPYGAARRPRPPEGGGHAPSPPPLLAHQPRSFSNDGRAVAMAENRILLRERVDSPILRTDWHPITVESWHRRPERIVYVSSRPEYRDPGTSLREGEAPEIRGPSQIPTDAAHTDRQTGHLPIYREPPWPPRPAGRVVPVRDDYEPMRAGHAPTISSLQQRHDASLRIVSTPPGDHYYRCVEPAGQPGFRVDRDGRRIASELPPSHRFAGPSGIVPPPRPPTHTYASVSGEYPPRAQPQQQPPVPRRDDYVMID